MRKVRGDSVRKALLVAFHFPPFKGSSGIERTLGFSRSLSRFGWRNVVLSANPRAYPAVSNERLGDVPNDVVVKRAFALDASRHFRVAGRYPRWSALPDRWITWLIGGVISGLRIVRREHPVVLWSTYPIATAHLIGYWLARLTGLPWVADFRDPMVEHDERSGLDYPLDPQVRRAYLTVEGKAAAQADALVFCTSGAARIFRDRYPEVDESRIHIIPNGFDEAAFASVSVSRIAIGSTGTINLLHSGVLYPGPDRDPTPFLQAVRGLLNESGQWRRQLRITLRATGHDEHFRPIIRSLGLEDVVFLAPMLHYREALAEMQSADALLIFQGHTSNPAIPAKLYEYFRAGRPILALVDAGGDTAALLRKEGVGRVLQINDSAAISKGLAGFLLDLKAGVIPVMSAERVSCFERRARARDLAAVFDNVTQTTTATTVAT